MRNAAARPPYLHGRFHQSRLTMATTPPAASLGGMTRAELGAYLEKESDDAIKLTMAKFKCRRKKAARIVALAYDTLARQLYHSRMI